MQTQQQNQNLPNYTPCSNSYRECLDEAVLEVSNTISGFICELKTIFHKYSIDFLLEWEYVKKVITAMVTPSKLKISYELKNFHYILKKKHSHKSYNKYQINSPPMNWDNGTNVPEWNNDTRFNDFSQSNVSEVMTEKDRIYDFQNGSKFSKKESYEQNIPLITNKSNEEGRQSSVQVLSSSKVPLSLTKNPDEIKKMSPDLTEPQKYELLSEWIREETEIGRKVPVNRILDQVNCLNTGMSLEVTREWLMVFLKKTPEINDLLVRTGNAVNIAPHRKIGRRKRKLKSPGYESSDSEGPAYNTGGRKVKSLLYQKEDF